MYWTTGYALLIAKINCVDQDVCQCAKNDKFASIYNWMIDIS